MTGLVVNSTSYRYTYDDLFNEIEIKITKVLYDAGYMENITNYPHLEKIKGGSSTVDEILINLNNHFRENSDGAKCKKLIKLIKKGQGLGLNKDYELVKYKDRFYLNSSGVSTLSGNPFWEQDEVSKLIDLYGTMTSKKYGGDDAVKLKDGLSTMADFCCEINRIYTCITPLHLIKLKPILKEFANHKDVKCYIDLREDKKNFYQFVKKEIGPVEEQIDPAKTQDNIQFFTAVSDVSAPILSPATEKRSLAPSYNPFFEEEQELLPEAKQLSELDLLKATYSAIVDGPYQKNHSLDEILKLTNENISSVADFCRELNKIKNNTNGTSSRTRYKLLVDFSQNEEVKKLIGIMEGAPKDFYVKPTVGLCNNGLLLERMLNEYVNIEKSMLRAGHVKKIRNDLKNITLRDNISIELEKNDHVMIRDFPDDNRKIALVLTALLEQHQSKGTLSQKIAEFLKISRLGAYMQLQPLPDNKIHVVFNRDNLASVNGKIDNLAELMNFMQKHLKDVNTELANLPQRPAEGASLEQLQKYFYQQILAFETQSSTYDGVKSVKEWVKKYWGKLLGHADSETFFGAKMKYKPIDTIKNLRQAFHSNLRHENYEKSALNSPEYKIIDQGLGRMQKQAQTLHDLIARNIIPTDITENLTAALRYSMASECVELKQQSKSINFNHFISKAKVVIPIATVASLIVLAVFPPAAPIAAAILFSAALIYLFTKFKPKLETSAASKQLSSAMTELVYQLPFQLVSHDVSWGEAWKDRKGPIMQAIKSWWSGSEAPGPNLSESLNPSPE